MENDGKEELQFPADIRKTKQREEVYRILASAAGPVSAAEIYCQLLQEEKGNFAISTIYRALAVFEEKGYVVKTSLTGCEMSYYEWRRERHRHYAVCLKCHKLVPLKVCPFEHIKVSTSDENFTVTSHKLEIYGYCDRCKNEGNGSEDFSQTE